MIKGVVQLIRGSENLNNIFDVTQFLKLDSIRLRKLDTLILKGKINESNLILFCIALTQCKKLISIEFHNNFIGGLIAITNLEYDNLKLILKTLASCKRLKSVTIAGDQVEREQNGVLLMEFVPSQLKAVRYFAAKLVKIPSIHNVYGDSEFLKLSKKNLDILFDKRMGNFGLSEMVIDKKVEEEEMQLQRIPTSRNLTRSKAFCQSPASPRTPPTPVPKQILEALEKDYLQYNLHASSSSSSSSSHTSTFSLESFPPYGRSSSRPPPLISTSKKIPFENEMDCLCCYIPTYRSLPKKKFVASSRASQVSQNSTNTKIDNKVKS